MPEFPTRPEGTSDHPYYHLPELLPEELERYNERINLAEQFFFGFAKFYRKQDWRLKHRDELMTGIFPGVLGAKEEAEAIGEITPQTVINQFNLYRENELEKSRTFLEKQKAEGKKPDAAQQWVEAAQNLNLKDTYLAGSFYALEMQLGRKSTDKYSEKFPEVVDLMKQALEIQPKSLPGSPSLPSPNPPDVIEGTASKK